MTVHDILCRARNLMEDRPWWQAGRPRNWCTVDSVCVGLAISDMVDKQASRAVEFGALRAFADAAGIDYSSPNDIYRWNDANGRTKEEVLATLARAIAATAPEPDVSFIRDSASIEVA